MPSRSIVLGCVLLWSSAASAADDTAVRVPPLYDSFLPPAIGQSYTDPVFGVAIKRVSDARNMPNNAGSGDLPFVGTEYSTASPFNSDNSRLILQHHSYFGLYDGNGTYLRDLPLAVTSASEPRWSRSDPNVLYYVRVNDLMKLDVAAGTSTVVRSFGEYAAIRGRGESDISRDGDHFVFSADERNGPVTPGVANRYVFVYEISTDTKGPVLDTIGHSFDQLYIAPNNSVLIGWYPPASGTARFTGLELFDRNMVFQRQLTHAIGHMHLTRDTNGDDVVVWANSGDPQPIANCQNGIVKVRLSDAAQTCLLQLDWSLAAHITAGDGNGWVFVGTYDPTDPPPAPPDWKLHTNEMLQLKLDGTEVRRLFHHRSRETANYQYQPRATVSRDGSRLVFTSNYNLQARLGYPSDYTDAFFVSVPALPPPRISIGDASVVEGNGGTAGLVFTVTLSRASTLPVSVRYATVNGTAIAPGDYGAIAATTLTFAPGQTTKTITVLVNGDMTFEPDETLFVALSTPENAGLADDQGLGTIVNDEPLPPPAVQWTNLVGVAANGGSLTRDSAAAAWNAGAVSRQTLNSGDGYVEFTATELTTDRMLGLGNGDASQSFSDIEFAVYLRGVGSFMIYESGEPIASFPAYAAGDRFRIGVESGVVRYRRNGVLFHSGSSAPRYPLLVDTSLRTPGATVTDARVFGFVGPPPLVSIDDVAVSEGSSGTTNATFTASLSGPSTSTVTVQFATSNGTAVAPSDYVSTSGTLTFAPGETTRPVVVAVNGDTTVEFDETFAVTLSNPTNAVLGDATGIATIRTDEAPPPPPAVQWANLVGVAANGGSLTRDNAAAAWNAGAVSRQTLNSGDGYVEFTATELTTDRMLGLGNGDASQSYTDIEFAIYLRGVGAFMVYESGEPIASFPAYAAGDRFRIGVESGVVRYRRNGVLFHSGSSAPRYPLLVDTSLRSPGATVTDARVFGFVGPPPLVSIDDVAVTEGSSGTTNANFTASLSGPSTSTVTVQFATSNGTAVAPYDYVSTSGTLTFAPGETTRPVVVAVNGDTTVEFDETFAVTLSNPTNAVLGDGTGIATIRTDEAPPPPPAVQWTNLVGVAANGGSLTRDSAAAAWNAGAVSRQTLNSGDGYVEFTATELTTDRMLGLGNGDASQSFSDIEFAVYLRGVGSFMIYESGEPIASFPAYAAGDRFRIGVESGVVRYRRNGVLFHSGSSAPRYPLLVDTSLRTPGATVSDVRVFGFVAPQP